MTVVNAHFTENHSESGGAVVSIGDEAVLTLVDDTIVDNIIEHVAEPGSVGGQAAVGSANVHVDGELVSVATVVALPNGGGVGVPDRRHRDRRRARGVIRPQGPGCEIGAAEVVVPVFPVDPTIPLPPNFTG